MDEKQFQHNMAGAKSFQSFSNPPDVYFWEGYQRGMRRNYHGDTFGTPDEHKLWMALADEKHDQERRFRGLGYRAGFLGTEIAEAIRQCGTLVARSESAGLMGSAKSPRKSASSRENGKRGGRPRLVK